MPKLVLTADLRNRLSNALRDELNDAAAESRHEAMACRRAELAQLEGLRLGAEVKGDLLDAAGYFGFIDL